MDDERFARFLDAQEHPERYTEEELRDILQDGEGLAELKRALMEEKAGKAEIDVDAEWEKFSKEHAVKGEGLRVAHIGGNAVGDDAFGGRHKAGPLRWHKVAAMFIGVFLFAGIAYAAMVNMGMVDNPFHKGEVAANDAASVPTVARRAGSKATADTIMQTRKAGPTTKVFDNETLVDILGQMGKYYGVDIAFANESCKYIRLYFEWNQAKGLDENIKLLNSFRQITITRDGNTLNVE